MSAARQQARRMPGANSDSSSSLISRWLSCLLANCLVGQPPPPSFERSLPEQDGTVLLLAPYLCSRVPAFNQRLGRSSRPTFLWKHWLASFW